MTSLLAGGVNPKDIVILSSSKYANSLIKNIKEIASIQIIENKSIFDFKSGAINYFTVQSFKGLESKIVFLIDVKGFISDLNRMTNYVGMSRAKIMLYVFYHEDLLSEYSEAVMKGIEAF